MKKIKENLAALLKVKTLVTMVVTGVFAVLALRGTISPDNVMIIISMVVSFYFGTQHEKAATTTAPTTQPSAELRSIVPENDTYSPFSPVDVATYNQAHPDVVE